MKNLLDKEEGVDPAEARAMVDAEIAFQNNVTERWKLQTWAATGSWPSTYDP